MERDDKSSAEEPLWRAGMRRQVGPPFLDRWRFRNTAVVSVATGVVLGVVLSAISVAVADPISGWREWTETTASFIIIFGMSLPLAVVFYLLVLGLRRHVNRGFDTSTDLLTKRHYTAYTKLPFAFTSSNAVAAIIISVTSYLSQGEWLI